MELIDGMKGCGGCHKIGLKSTAEVEELKNRLEEEVVQLRGELRTVAGFDEIVGRPLFRPIAEQTLGTRGFPDIDRDLAASLERQFSRQDHVHIHRGDALQMDLAALCPDGRFRLVGNLPYNISTPLLFHLLAQSSCIRDMHFMLQKEVVERMAAAPGSKTYGRLSVALQARCSVARSTARAPAAVNQTRA